MWVTILVFRALLSTNVLANSNLTWCRHREVVCAHVNIVNLLAHHSTHHHIKTIRTLNITALINRLIYREIIHVVSMLGHLRALLGQDRVYRTLIKIRINREVLPEVQWGNRPSRSHYTKIEVFPFCIQQNLKWSQQEEEAIIQMI